MKIIYWFGDVVSTTLKLFCMGLLVLAMWGGGRWAYANYKATVPVSGTDFASKAISAVEYTAGLICDATVGTTNCLGITSAGEAKVIATGLADSVAITTQTGSMIGCYAESPPTPVSAGDFAFASCDPDRRTIRVEPYAAVGNLLNGQITTAMTATTSTAVSGMGAQGGSYRVYVTACMIGNDSALQGTWVNLQDGSGGTVLAQVPAGTNYQGGMFIFPTPIRTSANTGLYAVNTVTGASIKVSCTGFKGL